MEINIQNKKDKITQFLEKYPDIFTDIEKKYIMSYAIAPSDEKLVPDTVREVYDELGIIPDESNIYIGFMNLLSEVYNIENKKILEIGGGVLPRLGKRISKKLNAGKIVVYDPRLSHYEQSTDKMRLVREKFNRSSSIEDSDLIIGLMPCEAAEVIIDTAVNNNIDFVLALCEGGFHGDEYDFYESPEEWIGSMVRYADREVEYRGMGELKVKYLEKYGSPYPVIYNDRG